MRNKVVIVLNAKIPLKPHVDAQFAQIVAIHPAVNLVIVVNITEFFRPYTFTNPLS